MNHNNPVVEIGLAAIGRRPMITDENLVPRTIAALQKYPENEVEIILTSILLFAEQEADSKLLLHVAQIADAVEGKQPRKEKNAFIRINEFAPRPAYPAAA